MPEWAQVAMEVGPIGIGLIVLIPVVMIAALVMAVTTSRPWHRRFHLQQWRLMCDECRQEIDHARWYHNGATPLQVRSCRRRHPRHP